MLFFAGANGARNLVALAPIFAGEGLPNGMRKQSPRFCKDVCAVRSAFTRNF